MKNLVFLFPHEIKFNSVIKNTAYPPRAILKEEPFRSMLQTKSEEARKLILEENARRFRPFYATKINHLIRQRYRKRNFQVNWEIYDDLPVSDIVVLEKPDRIIPVGSNWHETNERFEKEGINTPLDNANILKKIGDTGKLVVGGFWFSDCIRKFFDYCTEKGLGVSIDRDLTDLHGRNHSFFGYD